MDVAAEIARLKEELGVELDRDLAQAVGVDPSAVAAWRRRGTVPSRYVTKALRRVDEAARYELPNVIGTTLRDAYIFSLIRIASLRLSEQIGFPGSPNHEAAYYGFRLAYLYQYLVAAIKADSNADQLRSKYESLKKEIDTADLPVWIETLPR